MPVAICAPPLSSLPPGWWIAQLQSSHLSTFFLRSLLAPTVAGWVACKDSKMEICLQSLLEHYLRVKKGFRPSGVSATGTGPSELSQVEKSGLAFYTLHRPVIGYRLPLERGHDLNLR